MKEIQLSQLSLESSASQQQADVEGLKNELQKATEDKEALKLSLESSLSQCQSDMERLRADLERAAQEKAALEEQLCQQMLDTQKKLLGNLLLLKPRLNKA